MRGHRGSKAGPGGSRGRADRVPVAIVGVGAILPDAPSAPAYWQNIRSRRYSIAEVPHDRWQVEDYYDPDPTVPDKTYSKIGAWVRGFTFDWKGFRIPPKVAAAMDEVQQWAVTIAAEALADYGYPARPLETERTGVVLGAAMGGELHYITGLRVFFPEYANALASLSEFRALPEASRVALVEGLRAEVGRRIPGISEDSMPGELPNVIAGRVANIFNLRGPNFIADAACASSFAALESACDLLAQGKADAVLCGGVDRNMGPSTFVKFCKIGALSGTGSRPFGAGADGFVMGEGGAGFLLKRLDDAERDGDKIYAVIRGIGGASDGKGKGITAPNPQGQVLAIRRAWEDAGLDPATCSLIEAHGTSTKVGDVVEVESLTEMFLGAPRASIGLGSAKGNVGHLKAGAGAAGLLKAVYAVHHRELPPTLHADPPNPAIDFSATPFRLIHECAAWEPHDDTPRRCGVSAYGFGGTNFHVVLEEYVPGMLRRAAERGETAEAAGMKSIFGGLEGLGDLRRTAPPAGSRPENRVESAHKAQPAIVRQEMRPLRGVMALGAHNATALGGQLDEVSGQIASGWLPSLERPTGSVLVAAERLIIDFGSPDDLRERVAVARQALAHEQPAMWRALANKGIFRGSGRPAGKVAFLFPGQGSQYANMGRTFLELSPVAQTFAEADEVLAPILGQPLTSIIFCDPKDTAAVRAAEEALRQTAVTQPAVLTLDVALFRLLVAYGFKPDMVMGHSLGEYAALVAAGVLPFAHALEGAAARGAEMTRVSMDDNGWMAAVMAPLDVVQAILQEIDGYVVPANINSLGQCVIGGASRAVEDAIALFSSRGYQAQRIPVSHAFHTAIVAPASAPLRQVLNRLDVRPPTLPVLSNVTGDLHPNDPEAIKDLLERQIASPVQWVLGLETLYAQGCRTFIEVGPKRALKGFVDEVLGTREGLISALTCHPKTGEAATFNQALCSLWAAGHGTGMEGRGRAVVQEEQGTTVQRWRRGRRNGQAHEEDGSMKGNNGANGHRDGMRGRGNGAGAALENKLATDGVDVLAQALTLALERMVQVNAQTAQTPVNAPGAAQSTPAAANAPAVWDRTVPPAGSIVISGTGLGLPGADKPIMDPKNALRVLSGEQFIGLVPEPFRREMLAKRVTRLVKSADGGGSFQVITDPDDVIRLAGRGGPFDLAQEYGVPQKLVDTLDVTSQLAMAAGLDALREAGIPMVQTWRPTSTGKFLPDRWMIPASMRDETGVIFASVFPGGAALAEELERYYQWEKRLDAVAELEDLRRYVSDFDAQAEICRRIARLRDEISAQPYEFDRRFIFRILSMGHSQFAEYIGARGPNTQVNAACATTTQAIAMAEDWIRSGRCRRVLVIAGDDVTGDSLMEWVGAGFLALGAAATDDRVNEAALPFDRRRHGTILGMGACALVVESEDAVRERGMRGIVEVLSTETANSAYHGSRLDVDHIGQVMEGLVSTAEKRFGVNRRAIAPYTVFVSHETYTPARGGSASAEVVALRKTFGEAARHIVVSNTKGFTGHPMGVGVEDVLAVKMLEHGLVPPVPNFQEVDPDLGVLNLSRGGNYPIAYALHLAAGFGSQVSMTFLRRVPGGADRIDDRLRYQHWLDAVSGYERAELETVQRVLRVRSHDGPARSPAPTQWRKGQGPCERAAAPGDGAPGAVRPAPLWKVADKLEAKNGLTTEAAGGGAPQWDQERTVFASPEPRRHTDARGGDGAADAGGLAPRIPPDAARQDEAGPAAPKDSREHFQERASAPASASKMDGTAAAGGTVADAITAKVLEIVSGKTGYPQDMLDLDLDLEADLGIDTVKQAETFVAIRQAYDIPPQQGLSLRDYPTLKSVVGFVRKLRPDLVSERAQSAEEAARPFDGEAPCEGAPPSRPRQALKTIGSLEDADQVRRRVPLPALRPPLEACKPTGVTLGPGSRVVVMLDEGCAGKELARRLAEAHIEPLLLEPGIETAALIERLGQWQAEGPVQGVYWLPALDVEPPLEHIDLAVWRELNRRRVKNLYAAMRTLYRAISGPGTFLLSATRLGGLHGYGEDGASAPLGGAVTGFTKAYAVEQGNAVLVKALDVGVDVPDVQVARWLISETLVDPAIVEVGYRDCLRYTISLEDRSARDGGPGLALGPESVILVTGAAGGITSAIVTDLAAASGGSFYLLDLAQLPAPDDEKVILFRQGRDLLKQALIEASRGRGGKPRPAEIDREIAAVERQAAALAAVEAVKAAGGKAVYRSLDLRDAAAVQAVVDEIRLAHGRIDLLIHAAGLLIDKTLPDKRPEQFDLVFDVKADGFFNLLKASQGMPLHAMVAFSSVAGRFGNNGQADYSAANDLLCKLTNNLPAWRPETRGIAIDWTAWGGIGMAARGSVPQIMEALGVDMLRPESGVPTVRRELTYGSTRGEVLIAGRLGAWMEERDPTGGLDQERIAEMLAGHKPPLMMVGRVTRAPSHGGIEIETTLDPKAQPFLFDHAPDPGTPWLPGVMAIEALAESATVLAPDYRVMAVENVGMLGAFKFFRMEPRTLHLSGTIRPAGQELLANMVLRSINQPAKVELPAQVKEHFTATVRLARQRPEPSRVLPKAFFIAEERLNTHAAEVYSTFFHGPAYRVVDVAGVDGGRVVARFAPDLTPQAQPRDGELLMAPRLVELCFQAAALWSLKTAGAMAFPAGLAALTVYRQEPVSSSERIWCSLETEDGQTFDGRVVDETGHVYVDLRGYRTIARPG